VQPSTPYYGSELFWPLEGKELTGFRYHLFLLASVLFIFLFATTYLAIIRDLADTPAKVSPPRIPRRNIHADLAPTDPGETRSGITEE
jgi:hypothetical protein